VFNLFGNSALMLAASTCSKLGYDLGAVRHEFPKSDCVSISRLSFASTKETNFFSSWSG